MGKFLLVGLLVLTLWGNSQRWTTANPTQTTCNTELGRIVLTSVPSKIYGKPVAVNVYLPPCYSAGGSPFYPAIYLLHGGGADETQWPDLNVQSASDALIAYQTHPFVVIMPGATYEGGINYGTFVIQELLPAIETRYRVQPARAGRAIGGLSLGGYWALKLAFLYPDLFAAVGGYSPVVTEGFADDPLRLIHKANLSTLQTLHILLDVGDKDSLVYDTQVLFQALRAQDLTVLLMVGSGGHNRDYWRAHTYDYLSFFLNVLTPTHEPKAPF